MTDFDAACYLRELQELNRHSMLQTPQNQNFDTIWDCAFDHAIRALLERQGLSADSCSFTRNPNGSYSLKR